MLKPELRTLITAGMGPGELRDLAGQLNRAAQWRLDHFEISADEATAIRATAQALRDEANNGIIR